MRYRVIQYAEALHAALREKPMSQQQEIMRRFAALLTRHRMSGKSDLIVAAYEKIVLQENGVRKVRIESASPVSGQLKKEIGDILGKKVQIEETVNPRLLAGVKILVDDELLIDASAQRQVEKIFSKK